VAKAIPEALTREAVDAANKTAKLFDSHISFSYDNRIEKIVIKIVQDSTDEVIRQIPPEMMIKMRQRLAEGFRGVIFDRKG
jgi:flagellar protein FlaG